MPDTMPLVLPASKKPVVVKSFVTGQIDSEVRQLSAPANKTSFEMDASLISDSDVGNLTGNAFPPGTKVKLDQDPAAQMKADDKLLELMVVSLDGNAADIMTRVMNLPVQDVNFLREKVNTIYKGDKVEGSDPKAPSSLGSN